MALENYVEMRDARALCRSSHSASGSPPSWSGDFPGRFIRRYSMVMFHPEIPYAEAQRRGARQEQLLDTLVERFGYDLSQPGAHACAERLLDAARP